MTRRDHYLRPANPPAALRQIPTSSLPRPTIIDTERYRLLCYTLEVAGERDIAAGSVARVHYGADEAILSSSEAIVVQEGGNEYCIGDLRNVPLAGGFDDEWTGDVAIIRFDPLELVDATSFRIDEFLLAPLDTAVASFVFRWVDDDPDDDAMIDLFLDPDRDPRNGNEIAVVEALSARQSNRQLRLERTGGYSGWRIRGAGLALRRPQSSRTVCACPAAGRRRLRRAAVGD